jgi:hypothetical protein
MSAHLMALTYLPLGSHFRSVDVHGRTATLRRTADSNLSPGELAALFRHPALVSARPIDDGIEVELADAGWTSVDFTLERPALDLGAYEQTEVSTDRLVLRRRRPGPGAATIEVRNVPTEEEEWRRLLAHDVDLVPLVSPGHVRYLRQVSSVRITPFEQPGTAALLFQLHGRATSDRRLRQAISLSLHRSALAALVNGDPAAAAVAEDRERASALLRELGANRDQPLGIRLFVYEGSSDFAHAALILQEQLATTGVRLDITVMSLEALVAAVTSGDFDAILLYGSFEPPEWQRFVTGPPFINMTRYSEPEFDRAVARGDGAHARALLERDLPIVPLYTIPEAAAVDGAFCGGHPIRTQYMTWIGDVHRCAPGETP